MRTAHNKTTPTNLYFLAEFHKKGPAGSEKQVINLVWPEVFFLSRMATLSVHLAMNVFPVDPSYSLFWNSEEVTEWCQSVHA